jgi:hypothetical protein
VSALDQIMTARGQALGPAPTKQRRMAGRKSLPGIFSQLLSYKGEIVGVKASQSFTCVGNATCLAIYTTALQQRTYKTNVIRRANFLALTKYFELLSLERLT